MNYFRSLLLFRERRSQRKDNAVEAACPPILNVPNEILMAIIDHLDLHDEFQFSQTCRAFRRLAQRDWQIALQQLTRAQRIEFWTEIAYRLPNHWICEPCGRLHAIDLCDRPQHCWRTPWCQRRLFFTFDEYYRLRHTHVQLALKLTRMGSVNKRYLKDLMLPFSTKFKTLSLQLTYTATPKVVAERFLLQVKREYRGGKKAISPNELQHQRICPHMLVKSSESTWIRPGDLIGARTLRQVLDLDGLSRDVHSALASGGKTFAGYCKRCPMDYTVLAHPGIVIIYSWHDLGSYTYPSDQQWTVNIWTHENLCNRGPVVHHQSGTVRAMYNLEGSVERRATEV